MWNHQLSSTSHHDSEDDDQGVEEIRDIHALTPPHPPSANHRPTPREAWETSSRRSSSLSVASTDGTSSENFTTISREFNALVLAGSTFVNRNSSNSEGVGNGSSGSTHNNLDMIGEEEGVIETNPLAIVPENNPLNPVGSPIRHGGAGSGSLSSSTIQQGGLGQSGVSLQTVKKDEVESKISAWQNAKIAKINNRFKREEAIINGLEGEQVQKAQSWMKKVERKLEEKRARALEKMENRVAKARRKAEEKRASAEAKRGIKVARVLEIAGVMRTVGRAPTKRSFF